MDKRIQGKNLIPGCEQLTRPEEIDALKKYLKRGIEARDSMLDLEENNLQIPGNSGNPNIVNIDSLDNRRLQIDGSEEHVLNISRQDIPGEKIDKELYKNSELLEGTEKNILLYNESEKIEENNIESLSGNSENIPGEIKKNLLVENKQKLPGGIEENTLSKDKEFLEINQKNSNLIESSLKIFGSHEEIERLSKDQETLSIDNKSSELLEGNIIIPGEINEPSLVDYNQTIQSDEVESLDDFIQSLYSDKKDVSLEKSIETIKDQKILDLNNLIEKIPGEQKQHNLEESNIELNIKGKEIDSLEKDSIKISKDKEPSLNNSIEKINTSSDVELENNSELLIGTDKKTSLESDSEKIKNYQEISELTKTSEKITGYDEQKDLVNSSIDLKNSESKIEKLNETVEVINTPGDTELSNLKEELVSEDIVNELEDEKLTLHSSESEPELIDKKITITSSDEQIENELETDNVKLSSNQGGTAEELVGDASIITIEEKSISGLITTSINTPDNTGTQKDSLEDHLETIEKPDDQDLLSTRIPILEDSNVNSDVSELEDTQVSIISNQGGTAEELEDYRENIKPSDVESLEDFIDSISNSNNLSLGDTQIKSPDNKKDGVDKFDLVDDISKISEIPGYYDEFSKENEEPGQIPKPSNPSSRFGQLDSMIGIFTDPYSSEGISQDKNPEGTIAETQASGGDIIFVETPGAENDDTDITHIGGYKRNYLDAENSKLEDEKINVSSNQGGTAEELEKKKINRPDIGKKTITDLSKENYSEEDWTDESKLDDYGNIDELVGYLDKNGEFKKKRPVNSSQDRTLFDPTKIPVTRDGDNNWSTTKDQETIFLTSKELEDYQIKQERENRVREKLGDEDVIKDTSDITHTSDYSRKTIYKALSEKKKIKRSPNIDHKQRVDLDANSEGNYLETQEDLDKYQKDIVKEKDGVIYDKSIKDKTPLINEADVTFYGNYNRNHYNELMKYLGTDDISVAENYQLTVDELMKHGNWGKKVASYLGAILSKNSKFLSVVPNKDVENFKTVVKSGLEYSGNGEIDKLYNEKSLQTEGISSSIYNPNTGKYEDIRQEDNTERLLRGGQGSLDKTKLYTPGYKLPEFSIQGNSLNPQAYLRWAVENTVGKIPTHGATKQLLINETLAALIIARDKLEEATGGSRSRLPGDSGILGSLVSGGLGLKNIGQAAAGVVGSALSSPLINPINRPDKDGNNPRSDKYKDVTVWQTNRDSDGEKGLKGILSKAKNAITGKGGVGDYVFTANYIRNIFTKDGEQLGMNTTLEDLCGVTSQSDSVNNVEDFRKLLASGKYISSANKVTGSKFGPKVMTLDSNHIWEVKFFPYVGILNGNVSWLPPIQEINTINLRDHGVKTVWSEWIPFTSFELQAKKMTQKTLGLYDGEISYPISMEFTNELRMTIADDAYKSWKSYFERCAEASVYLSRINDADYYKWPEIEAKDLTPIVRGAIHPGLYKNLAFRCMIYVMSPQFSTIRKFDFLVVLKDYQVDYQGETDASGTDLTVSFSIVGENPPASDRIPWAGGNVITERNDMKQRTDYSTILSGGVSSAIKLL